MMPYFIHRLIIVKANGLITINLILKSSNYPKLKKTRTIWGFIKLITFMINILSTIN